MKGLIKTRQQMLVVVGAFALILLLGTATYAFFNYTRTGGTNTVTTGRIAFNTDQNNDTLLLTNVFPSSSVPVGADSVAVHITGDTTYNDGEEFQITLVDVVNTVNGKTVPINYVATYVASTNKDIGTSKATDDAYFADRGSTTTVYKLTSTGEVSEGKEVLKGYITKGATGIDGTLTIQAYLDSSKVLISDTIQDGDIEVSGYVNGTPAAEVVLTTAEWNALQGANTLSFKIKAEANEGTWVEDSTPALPTMAEMCPGCKFVYTTNYYYCDGGEDTSTQEDFEENGDTLYNDYNDVLTMSGKNYFLGLKFNDITYKIEKAYACGIKGENPNNGVAFCIERSVPATSDQDAQAPLYISNKLLLNNIWQGSCNVNENVEYDRNTDCFGLINAKVSTLGSVSVYEGENGNWEHACFVYFDEGGALSCY